MGLRYALRSMGCRVKGGSRVYSDNLGVCQSAAIHSSVLKKKHCAVAYAVCREAVASGAVVIGKFGTHDNVADMATKALGKQPHQTLQRGLFETEAWAAATITGKYARGVEKGKTT